MARPSSQISREILQNVGKWASEQTETQQWTAKVYVLKKQNMGSLLQEIETEIKKIQRVNSTFYKRASYLQTGRFAHGRSFESPREPTLVILMSILSLSRSACVRFLTDRPHLEMSSMSEKTNHWRLTRGNTYTSRESQDSYLD